MEKSRIVIPASTGGRLVMGNPLSGFTKDPTGARYVDRDGQPYVKYDFNVAVPKNDASLQAILQHIYGYAHSAAPNFVKPDGSITCKSFAFKIIDGDSTDYDQQGNRWCDKEGYPGHVVFKFGGRQAVPCFSLGLTEQLFEPTAIKTGDYIRVCTDIKYNESTQNPGLYLNPYVVELVAQGAPIVSKERQIDIQAMQGIMGTAVVPAGAIPTQSTPPAPPMMNQQSTPPAPPMMNQQSTPPAPHMMNQQSTPPAPPMMNQQITPQAAVTQPRPDYLTPQVVEEEHYMVPGCATPFPKSQLLQMGYTLEHLANFQKV